MYIRIVLYTYICTYMLLYTYIHIDMYSIYGTLYVQKSRRRRFSYPHPKLSLGLVPYRPLLYSRFSMLKNVRLFINGHTVPQFSVHIYSEFVLGIFPLFYSRMHWMWLIQNWKEN